MLNLGILGRIGSFRRDRERHLEVTLMDVRFIVKNRMYIGNWNGRSHEDLKRAFFEAYGLGRAARCPGITDAERNAFALVDEGFKVAYHNFRFAPAPDDEDDDDEEERERRELRDDDDSGGARDGDEPEATAARDAGARTLAPVEGGGKSDCSSTEAGGPDRTSVGAAARAAPADTGESPKSSAAGRTGAPAGLPRLRRLSMLASLADSDVYPGCMFTVDVSLLNLRPTKSKTALKKLGSNMLLASRAAKILSLSGVGAAGAAFRLRFMGKQGRLARAGKNVKNVVHLGKDLDSYRRHRQGAPDGDDDGDEGEGEEDPEGEAGASSAGGGGPGAAMTLRERIWSVMEDPEYKTVYSKLITISITILIIVSVIAALIESLLMYADDTPRQFFVIETICVICFTIEFVLRLGSCPAPVSFLTNWMNLIDLVAIAPYYIDIVFDQTVPGLTVFRVVRLARIMTLFKSARRQAKVYVETLRQSLGTMYLLLLIDVIGALVLATLIYYAERGSYDGELKMWMRPDSYMCEVIVRRELNLTPVTDEIVGGAASTTTLVAVTAPGNGTAASSGGGGGLDCLERGWEGACCTTAAVQPPHLAPLNSVLLLCPMRHNSPDLNCYVNYSQVRRRAAHRVADAAGRGHPDRRLPRRGRPRRRGTHAIARPRMDLPPGAESLRLHPQDGVVHLHHLLGRGLRRHVPQDGHRQDLRHAHHVPLHPRARAAHHRHRHQLPPRVRRAHRQLTRAHQRAHPSGPCARTACIIRVPCSP